MRYFLFLVLSLSSGQAFGEDPCTQAYHWGKPVPLGTVEHGDQTVDAVLCLDQQEAISADGAVQVGAQGLDADRLIEGPDGGAGIWFDDDVRNFWKAETPDGRGNAMTWSDAGVATLVLAPMAINAIQPLVQHGWDGAGSGPIFENPYWTNLMRNAGTIAVTNGAIYLVKVIAGRKRPFVDDCGTDPKSHPSCTDKDDHYRSFPSGHSANAFAGAMQLCMNGAQTDNMGGRALEIGICAGSLTAAALVAGLRGVGDKHWATDLIVGALVGVAAGVAIPLITPFENTRGLPPGTRTGGARSAAPQAYMVVSRF